MTDQLKIIGLIGLIVVCRKLEVEVEVVMKQWESHNGLSRHQVTSIRRVQNMPLWTKYALTRADIQASLPQLLKQLLQYKENTVQSHWFPPASI